MLASGLLMGQEETPAPRQPVLPRAPERAAWTISYRYQTATPLLSQSGRDRTPVVTDRVLSIQIQKTGNIYHQTTNWGTGTQSEAWIIGQQELVKERGASGFAIKPPGPGADDYSKSDFDVISWLSMKYYAGLQKGTPSVFVFRAKNSERPRTQRESYDSQTLSTENAATPESRSDLPANKQADISLKAAPNRTAVNPSDDTQTTVYLDAKTQLPVRFDDGKTVATYQFTAPPTDTLVPPQEVTAILQRREKYDKATTAHPSAP